MNCSPCVRYPIYITICIRRYLIYQWQCLPAKVDMTRTDDSIKRAINETMCRWLLIISNAFACSIVRAFCINTQHWTLSNEVIICVRIWSIGCPIDRVLDKPHTGGCGFMKMLFGSRFASFSVRGFGNSVNRCLMEIATNFNLIWKRTHNTQTQFPINLSSHTYADVYAGACVLFD